MQCTLLRIINRLESVDSGRVLVAGHDISGRQYDINQLRKQVGMVFRSFNLFPHLTVVRSLTLAPIKLNRMPKDMAALETDYTLVYGCEKSLELLP
ncbi:MAG: ATP-binding cassette domain-containing protein [Syntrophobacteraceae bacterium]